MDSYTYNNRIEFIDEIANTIKGHPSCFYCFCGKTGVGKEFVLNEIEKKVNNNFKIYRLSADVCLEKKQRKNFKVERDYSVSFTLGGLIGISLSSNNKDTSKLNYVISNLNSLTLKKNIMIAAVNYDSLSIESREFLHILIDNKGLIEKRIKKKIALIITSNKKYSFGNQEPKIIQFEDHSKQDLKNYLINELKYSPDILTGDKINSVYNLCGTNLELVNCYGAFIINENDCHNSFEAIIDKKLNCYILAGHKYNIPTDCLEKLVYTSSNCIEILTPELISQINSENLSVIQSGFICAVDEYFFYDNSLKGKAGYHNYSFVSNKEKEHLYNNVTSEHSKIALKFYNNLSIAFEDEYFERAQFLYRYFNDLNKKVFALIVLALSKCYLLKDNIIKNKIDQFVIQNNTNEDILILYNKINIAYKYHYNEDYKKSSEIIDTIDFSPIDIVLAAELRRLDLKNACLGHIFSKEETHTLMMQLNRYVFDGIYLLQNPPFHHKEEKLLSLRIIFDCAPYVLDSENDNQTFQQLYDKSLLLQKYINENFVKKSYSEYIINVFNRKAFLFSLSAESLLYYEQAEAYFRENNILEELALTLASKAGINIDLRKYKQAVRNSKDALDIIDANNFEIPQEEKIYNNLYIAEFLAYEEVSESKNDIFQYANKTIGRLEKLLTEKPCGKNHVILTNIASLSLYIGNEEQYLSIKQRLEKSLVCDDVSDIRNNSINDFYRYHFAWYEFYRHLKKEAWEKSNEIINDLSGFYPALINDKREADLRVEAAKMLISQKIRISESDFCLGFLKYANSNKYHFSRGLLLSDLQFTAWG